MTGDGLVAIGTANRYENDVNGTDNKPIIWHGDNHQTKTEGPKHRIEPGAHVYLGDNLTYPISSDDFKKYSSTILDISNDGKVIVGHTLTSINGLVYPGAGSIPTVWTGNDFNHAISLKLPGGYTNSTAFASSISGDGKVIGGRGSIAIANSDDHDVFATTWSGENYEKLTQLPTINRQGFTQLSRLNQDGTIGVGVFVEKDKDLHEQTQALVWHGKDWQTMDKLSPGNKRYSIALDISNDGSVIVGSTKSDPNQIGNARATVWSGKNWQDVKELTVGNNIIASDARAVSGNGKVIGGNALSNQGDSLATIWYGNNWTKTATLPNLRKDNIGDSGIDALNHDGTIAIGTSHSDYTYKLDDEDKPVYRAILWKIKYTDASTTPPTNPPVNPPTVTPPSNPPAVNPPTPPVTPPVNNPPTTVTPPANPPAVNPPTPPMTSPVVTPPSNPNPPTTTPPTIPPVVIAKIDVANTLATINKMGQDSFTLMSMQSHALDRLQYSCSNHQGACFGIQQDINASKDKSNNKTQDTAVGLNIGYGFGNGLSVGILLDHSIHRKLPDSYRHHDNNVGIGMVVYYQSPTGYFGEISGAYDKYSATITRPTLANTELGVNDADIKGVAYGMKFGKTFGANQNHRLYTGISHHNITRDAYSENTETAFPVSYGKMQYQQTSAILGANTKMPITHALSWVSAVAIKHRLSGNNPTYRASLTGVDKYEFSHTSTPAKTQGYVATGLQYQIAPSISATFSPYISKTATGNNSTGALLRLEGVF